MGTGTGTGKAAVWSTVRGEFATHLDTMAEGSHVYDTKIFKPYPYP